jgi:sugar lactone lactonase YvrE
MAERTRWTARTSTRFTLGEGLRVVRTPAGRDVVMVDIDTGRLLALDPPVPVPPGDGGPDGPPEPVTLARLDVPLGAVAPVSGSRGWIVAAGTGIALLTADGRLSWVDRPEDGAPLPMRMNDATADSAGRFWATSMALNGAESAGSLYRVDRDGSVHRVLSGLGIPNGPVVDPAGTTLYLADSTHSVIEVFEVDPATGALGNRRCFARLERGAPDGMVVDDDLHLWCCVWGAGEVHRYAPDGALVTVLRVPALQPTSLCLVDGSHLMVTTATLGMNRPWNEDGRVLVTEVGFGAPPAAEFDLS